MKRPARPSTRRANDPAPTRVPERIAACDKKHFGAMVPATLVNEERKAKLDAEARRDEHFKSLKAVEQERDALAAELKSIRDAHEILLAGAAKAPCDLPHLERNRLPDERFSSTFTFRIGSKADGVSAHFHCGERADRSPAEVFLRLGDCMDKSLPDHKVDWKGLAIRLGYLARTFVDAWATSVSIGLQYGIPLNVYIDKHQHQQDVWGHTNDPRFPTVGGLLDFVSRWMRARYIPKKAETEEVAA